MVKQGQEMNGIMHDAKDTINKKKVLKKMGSKNSVSKCTKSFHCGIKEAFGVSLPSSKLSSKY